MGTIERCTLCGAPTDAGYSVEGAPLCTDCYQRRPVTVPAPLRPIIETSVLKYAPKATAPVCLFAVDQGLVSALHAEGSELYRAAMVCVLTPHIRAYLEQHDPKALAQLRAACGLVSPPTFDVAPETVADAAERAGCSGVTGLPKPQ